MNASTGEDDDDGNDCGGESNEKDEDNESIL